MVNSQPYYKNSSQEVAYNYSPDNLLQERIERHFTDTAIYPIGNHSYYYNDLKQLVKEKYSSISYGGKETIVEYEYNEQNKLAKMRVVRDDFYTYVNYTYDNGKTIEINVETNSWNTSTSEFYIPMSSFINPSSPIPIYYKELYKYDERGTMIEKKDLLYGEVKRTTKYEIEYY